MTDVELIEVSDGAVEAIEIEDDTPGIIEASDGDTDIVEVEAILDEVVEVEDGDTGCVEIESPESIPVEIELCEFGIVEIDAPDVLAGPRGESGVIGVSFGSGNPVVSPGIKAGSIYVVKNT